MVATTTGTSRRLGILLTIPFHAQTCHQQPCVGFEHLYFPERRTQAEAASLISIVSPGGVFCDIAPWLGPEISLVRSRAHVVRACVRFRVGIAVMCARALPAAVRLASACRAARGSVHHGLAGAPLAGRAPPRPPEGRGPRRCARRPDLGADGSTADPARAQRAVGSNSVAPETASWGWRS